MKFVFVCLLSVCCCIACQNNEAQVLPSVQRDNEQEGQFVILTSKDGSLSYHMDNNEGFQQMKTIKDPAVSNIKYILSTAKHNVERKLKPFSVLIILEGKEENTTYKSTVQALKELKIDNFKMINSSE